MSDYEGVLWWMINGEVGTSSKALAARMAGIAVKDKWGGNHPHDPADFNRCLMFLTMFPRFRARIGEMRDESPQWAALVEHWDELEKMFNEEAGPAWSKNRAAPLTYKRMRAILDTAPDPLEVKFKGGSIRFGK